MPAMDMRFFEFEHLPEGPMRATSRRIHGLALFLDGALPDGAEKSAGMRKLLEAKDCLVRAAMPSEPPRRLPVDADSTITPETCPERAHHGSAFRYCPVKGCGWHDGMPA